MVITWSDRTQKSIMLCLLLLLAWVVVSPVPLSAFAGIGGYISEKLLGSGANAVLSLGSGTGGPVVLGTAPTVSTLSATSSSAGGVVSATLHGNLSSLNGMPRADVYFEWGYGAAALTNSTAATTVTATGERTATINPAAGATVYYRFAAGTDGTAYGSTQSFLAGGAHGVSYWLLNTALPIIIGLAILVFVFMLTGNPIAALVAAIIGLVAFYIIQALVSVF